MAPAAPLTGPSEPPERRPHAVFGVAATVALVVPWVTVFGGPAWWSTTLLPLGVWVTLGASGVALVIAGGRLRRIGTALVAGDALGGVVFSVSFFVTALVTYGGGTGG